MKTWQTLWASPIACHVLFQRKVADEFYRPFPKLLEALPNILRDWLCFEEGPMLKSKAESDYTMLKNYRNKLTEANLRLSETN